MKIPTEFDILSILTDCGSTAIWYRQIKHQKHQTSLIYDTVDRVWIETDTISIRETSCRARYDIDETSDRFRSGIDSKHHTSRIPGTWGYDMRYRQHNTTRVWYLVPGIRYDWLIVDRFRYDTDSTTHDRIPLNNWLIVDRIRYDIDSKIYYRIPLNNWLIVDRIRYDIDSKIYYRVLLPGI